MDIDDATRIRQLEDRIKILESRQGRSDMVPHIRPMVTELGEPEVVPEITISHDQLANGRWRYKTSVTMLATDLEEVQNALQQADELGRREAVRRMQADTRMSGTADV